MSLPKNPLTLMRQVYKRVFPEVNRQLHFWQGQANNIPNEELKTQAIASLAHKRFHCEGGSILALMAGENSPQAIRFICAYQTISDYLDNLCDRSTSLDPIDFEYLHYAMLEAVDLDRPISLSYYTHRIDQEDGDYLYSLVRTCREVLQESPNYRAIQPHLIHLCQYYCDLQIHKHVHLDEREGRLKAWFNKHKHLFPKMEWYEFSACTGSTLGIFSIVSHSFDKNYKVPMAEKLMASYFPYIQGLHILLDYFIDQEEDELEGDLNFCQYYESEHQLFARLTHFVEEANNQTTHLPDGKFHQLINKGLLGLYLSDDKVEKKESVKKLSENIIKNGGFTSKFFYWNSKLYRKIRDRKLSLANN